MMQQAYDCNLPEDWATYSEIYLPHVRTAVETALPQTMDYLFPTGDMIALTPNQPMPYADVQRVQSYLEDLVRNKVNLKRDGLLTLKDAWKLNVGYGIVETEMITPMVSTLNAIFSNEATVETRQLNMGEPKEVVSYRYVNWRNVIPMPDGSTPETTSGVFFLDDMREDVFKSLYEPEDTPYMGNPDDIIQSVRDGNLSLSYAPQWFVMSSYYDDGNSIQKAKALNQIAKMNTSPDAPVRVPVLKCYFKGEHIWMTPEGTIIYHIQDEVQTFRCPIKKATPVPDSDNWFPKGDVESGKDAADGSNIFTNALMDLISHALHPTTIVNRQVVHDGDATFEPHNVVEVYGKVGDAVEYVSAPQLPAYLGGMGLQFEEAFATANGQPRELRGQGTAGVMRAGGQAFETLLQTTMGRAKLAASVLEMSWLTDTIQDIFIIAQIITVDDRFITQDEKSKDFIEKTITGDEMRHSFQVAVKLDDKLRKSPADKAMDIQLYSILYKDNPRYDQDAVAAWLTGDAETVRRLTASPEVQQAQTEALQAREEAQQKAEQTSNLNPAVQAQNGIEGPRAQGAAV
jgi:hypothetical protein